MLFQHAHNIRPASKIKRMPKNKAFSHSQTTIFEEPNTRHAIMMRITYYINLI